MALIPTRWKEHKIDGYTVPSVFTEGNGWASVQEGFYRDPSMQEEQLIERHLVLRNQFDRIMYEEHEEWEYEVPNGAPQKYTRYVKASVFLPAVNTGRQLMEVEREVTAFWTFCPWSKDALAFRREISGMVVCDLKPEEDLSGDAEAAANEKGYDTTDPTPYEKRMVIDTQRWWREAVTNRTFSEADDVNQTTRWVDAAIVEETEVTEEVDRWTKWIHRKNRIRPDDNRLIGPEYVQKESHTYTSHIPVNAPVVNASDAALNGIRVEVRGGGAEVPVALPSGVERSYSRGPEMYRVYRKKISEPARSPGADPYGIYADPSAFPARSKRQVIESTFIGDYGGVPDPDPDAGMPPVSSYSEPHDPSPVDPETWRHVADADNEADDIDNEEGHCTIFDPDVKDAGLYAYVAVSVLQESDSPLSNEDQVTKSGDGPFESSGNITMRENGDLEGDFQMPRDPSDYPPGGEDFGETISFNVPALVSHGRWPEPTTDQATLTSSHTVNTEESTFNHTPRENADEWMPGRRCRIVDRINPGYLRPFAAVMDRFEVSGVIKSTTDTTTTVENLDADGHEFPEGSDIEVMSEQSYDPRISHETGDEADGTMEALVLAIGRRQGLRYRQESFRIRVEVPFPLLTLRNGMSIILEDIDWNSFGNDIWLKSRIEQVTWRLRGFEIQVVRNQRDNKVNAKTVLTLEER